MSLPADTRYTNSPGADTPPEENKAPRRKSSSNLRNMKFCSHPIIKFKRSRPDDTLEANLARSPKNNRLCPKTDIVTESPKTTTSFVVIDARSRVDTNPCHQNGNVPTPRNEESVVEILMRTEPDISSWRSRLVYMLIVIVVGHVICWGPVHLMHVVIRIPSEEFQLRPAIRYLMAMSYFLENISGCINPITFCFMSKGFRSTLVCLICKLKNKLINKR